MGERRRIDLRSVTNVARQLPYHVACHRGHRQVTESQIALQLRCNSDSTIVPSSAGYPSQSSQETDVGRRHIQRILNPTVAIDAALEDCRESDSGYGPQPLATLAAYSLRVGLLSWLQDAQVRALCSVVRRTQFRRQRPRHLCIRPVVQH